MSKFRKGDKVRRIASDHEGMIVGDTAIVDEWLRPAAMHLVGFKYEHDPKNFELIEGAAPIEADPTGVPLSTPGAKADAGKARPTLIFRDMANALAAVILIATDGAAKYSDGGWLQVPNGAERYDDAGLRHMLKRFTGQPVDSDSQSLHLAHEAWNALAKLELHLRANPQDKVL